MCLLGWRLDASTRKPKKPLAVSSIESVERLHKDQRVYESTFAAFKLIATIHTPAVWKALCTRRIARS
jgi:hypothetical protein